MIEIPLANIPNQSFSIQLDNILYDITIKFIINVMTMTIIRSGTEIISNFRITPNLKIIPYTYLENGNFAVITANNEYPNYNNFGINQSLIYASAAELEAIRAGA